MCVTVLAGWVGADAAQSASPSDQTVAANATVLDSRTIGAGSSYTVNLTQVPADAVSANFSVTAQPTRQSTRVSLCGGRVVTTACKSTPVVTTSDSRGRTSRTSAPVTGKATVDLTGAGRMVTVYSSASNVVVSVQLTGYTIPAPAPAPAPTTPAPAPTTPAPAPTTPAPAPTTPAPAPTTPAPAPTTPAPAPTTPAPTPSPSGYPGASNTGYRPGTAFRVIEGDLHVTTANTVLDSVEVHGTVWVEAPGVVIRNSLITGRQLTGDLGLVMVQKPTYSVTIEDTEMYATYPSYHVNGVMGQNFTLRRVNIHGVIDQVDIIGNNVTIEDSWLHGNLHYDQDPNHANGPSHDDNIQVQVGSNLQFRHNTLADSHNAVLMVTQDTGVVSNLTYSSNSTSNGACSLNLAQKTNGPLQGFVIANNVFTRTQVYAKCAIIADAPSIPLFSLSNNLWTDGQAIGITTRS